MRNSLNHGLICSRRAMLVLALTVSVLAGSAEHDVPIDAAAQARVAQLIQEAIGPFRNVERPRLRRTNSAWENSLQGEKAFREASTLMPERLDLRFGIASALIGQATQTNGAVLEAKMHAALDVYEEIRRLDTNGFDAAILYSAYSRALGETNRSEAMVRDLRAFHAQRTREYVERFERIEKFLAVTPNDRIRKLPGGGKEHAIVVLGAALETNGLAKVKLIGRLDQALKLARANRVSPVLVTGGNQREGVTEAYVMSAWLRQHGISKKRIYMDDLARDTVGNALYSAAMLEKLKVTEVTIVTSISHIRRGLATLDEACRKRGLAVACANLAAPEAPPVPDRMVERIATYRDVLRVSGLWTYPGISR